MIDDKLVFPVTITRRIELTFNVSASSEDEAADIVDEMYMDGKFDDYFDDDAFGNYGHTIDVGEVNLYADPEIDENGFIE